jgi:hypothetical protein
MEMSGQLHAPAALFPGKDPVTDLVRDWVGLRACLDAMAKTKSSPFTVPAGNRTLVAHPLA